MLKALRAKTPDRKARLFQVASCRRIWELLPDDGRRAIQVAEQFTDGAATDLERRAARKAVAEGLEAEDRDLVAFNARHAALGTVEKTVWRKLNGSNVAAAVALAARAAMPIGSADPHVRAFSTEERARAELVLCVFGSLPFRSPPVVDPAWLAWNGGTVAKLAREAYEHRSLPAGHLDPARLGLLADALEDAGCTDVELLGHLRGPRPHVRGCWALDLVLEKK
jgi:hypothetical protein